MVAKKKAVAGWKIKSLADAFKERPPREYAVEGLFAFSSLNIIFGTEGSMKSLLTMDMGICTSEGMQWLPTEDGSGYKFSTTKCGVLYIDCDNGSITDDERINAFALSHGLTADEKSNFRYISMPNDFDISDQEVCERVYVICQALNVRMLIMDNLGLINSKDENSHEMAAVMGRLRSLADRGLCVIVIHHQRKTNGHTGGRLGENLRGHSSIPAALDLSLYVSRKDFDEELTIIPAKIRLAPVQTFGAKFQYEWIDGTQELQSAMFTALDVNNEDDKAYSFVVTILAKHEEMNKSQLIKEIMKQKIGQRIAKSAIEKAISNKIISVRKGAHNTTFLSLNIEEHEAQKLQNLQAYIDME